jgi:hypothetical protein
VRVQAAERASKRSAMEPGMHYCKGVYARYTAEPQEALKEFNMCRKVCAWCACACVRVCVCLCVRGRVRARVCAYFRCGFGRTRISVRKRSSP